MKDGPILKGCETLPPMEPADKGERRCGSAESPPKRRRTRTDARARFAMLNEFVDCTMAKVPRTDALVWLVLFRDARGALAKSGQGYIAKRAGVCLRTVKTSIRRLQRAGLLDVVHQGGLNRGVSIYRIRSIGKET